MKKVLACILVMTMVTSLLPIFNVSAASMTDDVFFAKFNYVAYPELSTVKDFVDKGDYMNAKAALLEYFKERHAEGKIKGFGVAEADANYGLAVMGMRNILAGANSEDIWQSEFYVTSSSFSEYDVPVTDYVAGQIQNGYVSFMLFAGEKGKSPVFVKSKEAGIDVSPKLQLVIKRDGEEETLLIEDDKDTYISSGNTGTNYGKETDLVINEDGTGSNSVGANSRRTYLNFPVSEAANTEIISAKLILNVAYDASNTEDRTVLVISIGDTTWGENNLTWSSVKANMFTYENADVPTWGANAPNADSEYHNVTARFWFGKPMAYEYLSYLEDPELYNETHPYSATYSGEEFGPKLVKLMDAFATQRNYGWNRTLETGERLSRWVDIMDVLLETDVFDTRLDEFCNIISFMWGDCNYLSGLDITNGSYWWSNWRIISNAGFFKAVEFFPEFTTYSTWREKVESNVIYTLDLLYNDDYSFTEAGPAYSVGCINHFTECVRAAEMSGNPMSRTFIEKLKFVTRNALESFYPNGYDTNIGDSNFTDSMASFKLFDKVFNGEDKVLHSYVTGEDQGAEYLTRYYHRVNSAYMRNSWNPDDAVYINFTNNPSDGHYHPDSNQVLFYAYGEPLLVDSGRYSYSSANNIYDILRTAASHNTIEAVGLTMGAHSAATSANSLDYAVTNDVFDFAVSEQHGYSNVSHTRNVFFSRKGFGIVTDYVVGNTERAYRQNWHFLPLSNAEITEDGTVKTNFYNKANVTVSAASSEVAQIKDGYHSITYGVVTPSEYASFEKVGTNVKFDTLLYPERAGEDIEAYLTDLAEDDISKAAVKMTVNGEDSYYYVRNTDVSDGKFGDYITDGKMAYVSENEYMLADGKVIEGKIESPNKVVSVGVEINEGVVTINGEKLQHSTDTTQAIKIYAPRATSVILNGEGVEFNKIGDYIYAAASTIKESITGAKARIYPDKDGFVASSSGNEGATNPTYMQAARNWQNRNAYMAFDISEFVGKEITNATLNMKMMENASAGTLHFYYLDYGTWTRDNLTFVLDSSKMPTHTSTSGGFTGYAYRWNGSPSGTANGEWFSLTTNLTEYLPVMNNYKFTWAMLSESGSTRVHGIGSDEDSRPYLEITYNYTVEGEDSVPVVTVNKYADGELASTDTYEAEQGAFYVYDAAATIEHDGKVYYLDNELSDMSVVVGNGENVIDVYYEQGVDITVKLTDSFGEPMAEDEVITVSPFMDEYTYSPIDSIETENAIYILDTKASSLNCAVAEGAVITAVYKKAYDILGANLITNGSFEDEEGNFSVEGWLSPQTNQTIGSPYTTNNFYAVSSTTAINNGVEEAFDTTIPDGEWALGTKWNDGATGLCSIKRYVEVESGKTYIVSYKVKHKTGASGGYLKTSLVAENGAGEADNAEGTGYIGTEWTTVTRTFTATEDTDHVLFHFRWLGGDGNPGNGPYWLFDDFAVREVTANKIFDYTVSENEGKLVCDITVDSPDVKKFTVVIAQYDEYDCLTNAYHEDKKVESTREFEVSCDKTGASYEIFFLESLQNLKPIE